MNARGAALAATLRQGVEIADFVFDALLPPTYRSASADHWTPVGTAMVAARWLCPDGHSRVLDVGSGAGKLCAIGALVTGGAFFGVEQRPHLVEVAQRLAADLGAHAATFLCADAFSLDWTGFDGLYFFNPFAEADHTNQFRLDETVPHAEDDYPKAMARLAGKLAALKPGTRVAVFHALGCDLPEGFHREARSWHGHSALDLWIRR